MNPFDLDSPIIELASSTSKRFWTLRHAVEGVQIFGGIGSGKTSGSGRMLALKYLAAGFGGLVLTVKPSEKKEWVEYCRLTNRQNDLIVLEPGGRHCFNFLQYESRQTNGQQAITENIVEVLKTVIRAGEEKSSGKSDDPFWETALDMLIFNVIDLCKLAYNNVSIQLMYDIVQTIPKEIEGLKPSSDEKSHKAFQKAFEAARKKVDLLVHDWYNQQPLEKRERFEDTELFEMEILERFPEARMLKFLDQFFMENFINLSEKTRSIIDFTFSGFLFRLLREPIYSLFCKYGSTFTPDDCLDGKIILLNLPVKTYHKVGRDCQILFKYIWQRTMEKRDVSTNDRPVFLWADEAQNFLHEHDTDYQATARSSRIATVYISQNIPNYYASMSGKQGEYKVKSFLGTLGTKIFHANADVETNKYSSELIGQIFFVNESDQTTLTKEFSKSQSKSLELGAAVRPEEFISLKTGGPHNNFKVQGYMHRQGDHLFNNANYLRMSFDQNYKP